MAPDQPSKSEVLATESYQGVVTGSWSTSAAGKLQHEKRTDHSSWRHTLKAAFLPEGYPGSTSSDYLAFQVWDSVQALSSYIRGMLSSQAILTGVGVGKQAATPVSAVFQFFLRDLTGMLGGMLFAFWQGSGLDMYAKQWRLFADILNNVGYTLEMVSPIFPRYFLLLACLGSLARAITGVAGGATRAALTQHFAQQGNAADISAKEGTQETATTLVGMVLGMLLTRVAAGAPSAATFAFCLLTLLHVVANIRAMRALQLQSINPHRLQMLLRTFIAEDRVPTPAEVAEQDILLPPAVTGCMSCILGRHCPALNLMLGVPLHSLVYPDAQHFLLQSIQGPQCVAANTLQKSSRFILDMQPGSHDCRVVLRDDAEPSDVLRAAVEAHITSGCLQTPKVSFGKDLYLNFCSKLDAAGWSLNRVLLTQSQWRAAWGDRLRSGHQD